MDIAFHIGANCTDEDRLLRSLLRNVDRLAERGVAVPGPGRYRKLLREAIQAQILGEGAAEAPAVLLDAILDGRDSGRVVLSNSTFLALPQRVFDGGTFMGNAAPKVAALRRLFPEARLELHLALRNPATLLPAVFEQSRARSLGAWMGGADPREVRWSPVVAAMRAADPPTALTVWCDEDAPFVWGEALARLAGQPAETPLEGRHDLARSIMRPEGAERFESYMAAHPGQTASQERRVVAAFLERFADPAQVEQELDLPGWDEGLVDEVTRAYEADVQRVARMPGVTFLQP